jgi:Zn-dependent peptidase ImmA (M78 family)
MAWQLQVGDPSRLAISVAFTTNPDGPNDASTREESESWGSFTIWVDGENLCAHHELGELVDSCHWYLFPLLEWLSENWNTLFHEERLPLRNSGASAAEGLAQSKRPPLSLKDVDEFDWMADWASWWRRHNIRAARFGGVFPDLYVRRYRDRLEISIGTEPLPGVPREHSFVARDRVYRLDLAETSSVLFDVLSAAIAELKRRLPESERLRVLDVKLSGLKNKDEQRWSRLALLSGLQDDPEAFVALSDAVAEAFADVEPAATSAILSSERDEDLVIVGTALARLLYGALSPEMTPSDVLTLSAALLANYSPGASLGSIQRVGESLQITAADFVTLRPGAQGSELGEIACGELVKEDSWVDVESALETLGVKVDSLQLSDTKLRAVSIFGEAQPPVVFCNSSFAWGTARHVKRFTLAHELCHLLLDRELGEELAVASGPWAPLDIEQRANAFAAAFLMPTWLLKEHIAADNLDIRQLDDLSELAKKLDVGISALVERLHNLGEVTSDERWRLRSAVNRGRAARGR